MWGLLCRCWSDSPKLRPTINEICDFPPIANTAMILGILNRAEDEFATHSSAEFEDDKMHKFILALQNLLGLSLSHDICVLERIFTIVLEKCPMENLITIIRDEYSPAGRTCIIDLLHEVAIFADLPSLFPSRLFLQMLQFENKLKYRRKLDRLLTRVVKETGQIPSLMIIRDVTRNGSNPVAGGGFADVWNGMRGNIDVALKVLRMFGEGELNKQILRVCSFKFILERGRSYEFQAFFSEVLLWHRLHHSNVMPFLGVSLEVFAPRYALVSPWMNNGHLLEYLRKRPMSDRRALVQCLSHLRHISNFDPLLSC